MPTDSPNQSEPLTPNFQDLAQQFNEPNVRAILLMGSYARGDAGPFSDVDLLRLTEVENSEVDSALSKSGSHLLDGYLVNVSDAAPKQIEAWFTEPQQAVTVVASLRDAEVLLDPENLFPAILQRANDFVWDEAMQAKANAYASQEMVGWVEEVLKGIEGLRRMDLGLEGAELDQEATGRLLNARFGCSFGLSHVMQVQRGIAVNSDNAVYADVAEAIGSDSAWSRLRSIAFGVGTAGRVPTLREQVEAGLLLYVETARLLNEAILAEHRPLIQFAADKVTDYW